MEVFKIIDKAISKKKRLNIVIDNTQQIKMLNDGRLVIIYKQGNQGSISPLLTDEHIKKLVKANIVEKIKIQDL